MFEVAIITASDKGAKGLREDLSGPCIKQIVEESDYKVVSMEILPDNRALLADKMIELADKEIPLILTTGGTGFSPRDNTPEATKDVIEKETPGISEAMRMYSLKITPRAMLSRATSGIRKKSLIINLPGSPKAVRECLEYLLPTLDHGLKIMLKLVLETAERHYLNVDEITRREPQLLHGPVGAVVARTEYGIENKEILGAIKYHTTGRKNMSVLEKIIYLADFIEPGRSYPGVDKLRKMAFENLDDAMIQALTNTIRYISGIGGLIHERTVSARNYLILEKMDREKMKRSD